MGGKTVVRNQKSLFCKREEMTERDVVEGLTMLQNLFVTNYINCGQDLSETGKMMGRTTQSTRSFLASEKVQHAISNRLKVEPIAMRSSLVAKDEVPFSQASKEQKLDMLWGLARKASELIYDKEGNEVIMNGAVAVSAVRTMNDMTGDWAPKEQNITIDIKDERSISEVKSSIDTLMAEYVTLSGEVNSEVKAIENVQSLSVD